ncbi:unnamed protein product [Phytomonas sp. EM1]|nr:unnamed protein product [Phytomonas sp. EM1]|eukprot:CCW65238.1 unnamed protein product [Phytomonas sp. isolate EM1]
MLSDTQNYPHEQLEKYYENPTSYILHYGFPIGTTNGLGGTSTERNKEDQRRSFQAQDEAYLRVQCKIGKREDKARALLISANVLSMSVMASQLRLYRWRVSEAQTITQATSILQDEVFQAIQRGYCVSRRRAPRPDLSSNETKVMGSEVGTFSRYAHKTRSEIHDLFNIDKVAGQNNADTVVAAASMKDDSDNRSICSADLDLHKHLGYKSSRRNSTKALPGDAITQLVIVDSFTHEPFTDIMDYLRYFNNEYGLELVVVLLLHSPVQESLINTEQAQGAGLVLVPQNNITAEEAYACGYDLVLAHHFDHIVVDMLTQTFITSSGRWRNDVRSKAAVGNYASMRSILMGKLDSDELRHLAWNDSVDDNEILDVLNMMRDPTLTSAKETRLSKASSDDVSQKSTEVSKEDNSGHNVMKPSTSVIPNTLSRLRVREFSTGGVKSVATSRDEMPLPLTSLGLNHDVLSDVMNPSKAPQRSRVVKAIKKLSESESINGELFVYDADETKAQFFESFEKEISRLVAENTYMQREVEALRNDLDSAQQVINSLQHKRPLMAHDVSFKDHINNQDSISFAHLTKEQQVYALKERLDMANETIQWLMNECSPRSSSLLSPSRRRVRSSGGDNIKSIMDRKRVAILADIRRNELQINRKRRVYQAYLERREEEMMVWQDFDAAAGADESEEFESDFASSSGNMETHDFIALRMKRTPIDLAEECRERAVMNNVIDELQNKIKLLRCTETENASPDRSAALLLERALEQIHTLKGRIQHLEEIQTMNEAWYKKYVVTHRKASGKKSEEDEKGTRSAGRPRSSSRSIKNRAQRLIPAFEKKQQQPGNASDQGKQNANEGKATGGKFIAGMRKPKAGSPSAKPPDTYRAVEAKGKTQLARGEAYRHEGSVRLKGRLRDILARLHIKIRRPYTLSYRKLLEVEHAEAEQKSQRAWNQLQSLLKSLPDSNLLRVSGQHITPHSVNLGLVNPEVRIRIEKVSKEWARYACLTEHAMLDMKEVDKNIAEDVIQQLVARRQGLLRCVKNTETDLKEYLDAVKDLAKVELELSNWLDVDVSQYLDRNEDNEMIEVSVQTLRSTLSSESPESDDTMIIPDTHYLIRDMRELLKSTTIVQSKDSSVSLAGMDNNRVQNGLIQTARVEEEPLSLPFISGSPPEVQFLDGDKLLAALELAPVSPAQRALHKVLLNSYTHGFLHPKRMIEVNAVAGLESDFGDEGVVCTRNATTEGHGVNMMQLRCLYWIHHEELMQLLRLLSLRVTILQPLLSPYIGEMENMLSEEFHHVIKDGDATIEKVAKKVSRFSEDNTAPTLPFLIAADSALISSCVDILGTMWQMRLCEAGSSAAASAEVLHGLVCSDDLQHLSQNMERRVKAYYQTRCRAVDALRIVQKEDKSVQQIPNLLDKDKDRYKQNIMDNNTERSELFLTETFTLPHVPDQLGNTEAKYTADQLAALFSMKPRSAARANDADGLKPEDIYLDYDMDLGLGDNLKGGDENTLAIQRIRVELEYLNAARRQRLEELELRHRYQSQKQQDRSRASPVTPSPEDSGTKQLELGTVRGAHDFEVKGGCPAWYGMEASKRVRDILRRRTKPDQIILNAGPNGSGVGIELSRRTALLNAWLSHPDRKSDVLGEDPSPDRRSSPIAVVVDHGMQPFPPSTQRELSGWHRLRQCTKWASGPPGVGEVQANVHRGGAEEGYTCPRDSANFRAFENITTHYNSESLDRYLHTPTTLLERLEKYRYVVKRAAARLGLGNPLVEESFGGSPFYVVMKTGSPSASPPCEKLCRDRLTPRVPLPNLASWTYGIGDADLERMLGTPVGQCDSVTFVPNHSYSAFLKRYSQEWRGDEHNTTQSPPPFFLAGALHPSLAVSPASAAVQRLTFLLRSPVTGSAPEHSGSHVTPFTSGVIRGRLPPSKQLVGDGGLATPVPTTLPPLERSEAPSAKSMISLESSGNRSNDALRDKLDSTIPRVEEEVLRNVKMKTKKK